MWNYKIQPVGTFDRNGGEYCIETQERLLDMQGSCNWELVCVSDGLAYFKKEVQDKPMQEKKEL